EAEPPEEALVYDLGPLDDEELLAEPEPEIDLRAPDGPLPPVGVDVPGPRRARLEGERRRKRRRELRGGLLAAAVAVLVGIVGAVSILSRDRAPSPGSGVRAGRAEPADTITTTLLFGTKETRAEAGPTWMTLLSYDDATGRAAVVYIPAHTATGVPGRGLLPVGEAFGSGGVPLLLLATETLLGTPVDQYVELSDADAGVLMREIGELTVDVPQEVRVSAGPGQARLIFAAGPQRLSPEFLVDLLYVKGLEGDDVELGARHLAYWGSLFEAFSFDADGLGAAVTRSGAALGESDASLRELARLFEQLAGAESGDRALASLPVQQVGVGGSELYQADEDDVRQLLRETVGEQAVSGREVRVQILNGNGAPGVGQYVAERLGGEGFRVILSGNARRLNYRETLVITYDRSSRGVGLAERTRDLIGVGEVQVAAQDQGIVDLTIVVGKDFLETL
ncbi:MAG TPA: LCP family protein, partial [Actinomycetota bacterium]|nr:LCP family protein [Actinomycetota bacterium]